MSNASLITNMIKTKEKKFKSNLCKGIYIKTLWIVPSHVHVLSLQNFPCWHIHFLHHLNLYYTLGLAFRELNIKLKDICSP